MSLQNENRNSRETPQNKEASIEVVATHEKANYPFSVQAKATENWLSSGSTVTLAAAQEQADELQKKYPGLRVRILHCNGGPLPVAEMPKYVRRVGSERPYADALWTGVGDPPRFGDRVTVTINRLGPGTVTGYAVVEGYLGVMIKVDDDTRPEWHKTQNPKNQPSLAFGPEIMATNKDGAPG